MPFDTAHADDAKHTNRTKLIIKVFFLFPITLILRFDFTFLLFLNDTKEAESIFLT
ncbi:conserved domain protein [Bacteroides clarus YIT 12056]|uniref:Conserved domain protein n=1 Tax=Bacteroides clarus YIT 12056 TaxID=762984 RepID=A0ABP2KSM5_9BACE|nr:conserved domain protein [Bacteroides clarus YIT 12056]